MQNLPTKIKHTGSYSGKREFLHLLLHVPDGRLLLQKKGSLRDGVQNYNRWEVGINKQLSEGRTDLETIRSMLFVVYNIALDKSNYVVRHTFDIQISEFKILYVYSLRFVGITEFHPSFLLSNRATTFEALLHDIKDRPWLFTEDTKTVIETLHLEDQKHEKRKP